GVQCPLLRVAPLSSVFPYPPPFRSQVDLVDEPVAHEGAEHLGLQLVEPEAPPLALDELAQGLAVGVEGRDLDVAEVPDALEEGVQAQVQLPLPDARMASEQPGDLAGDQGARAHPIQLGTGEQHD